jgi:hypothetical protein
VIESESPPTQTFSGNVGDRCVDVVVAAAPDDCLHTASHLVDAERVTHVVERLREGARDVPSNPDSLTVGGLANAGRVEERADDRRDQQHDDHVSGRHRKPARFATRNRARACSRAATRERNSIRRTRGARLRRLCESNVVGVGRKRRRTHVRTGSR